MVHGVRMDHPNSFSNEGNQQASRRLDVEVNIFSEDEHKIEEVLSPQKGKLIDPPLIQEVVTPEKKLNIPNLSFVTRGVRSVQLQRSSFRTPPRKRKHSKINRISHLLQSPTTQKCQEEWDIEEVRTPEKKSDENSYALQNTRTFQKQMEKFLPLIELDADICYVWLSVSFWKVLVKDGDNFFSVLESAVYNTDQIFSIPSVGQRYRFEGLVILERITPSASSVILSILANAGHSQKFYCRLLVNGNTKWSVLPSSTGDANADFEPESYLTSLVPRLEQLRISLHGDFVPN